MRFIVSPTDPVLPNWIEAAGRDNATMCWRWVGASEHPPVSARVMKRSELV